jgi:hypothetical protein
MKQSIYLFGIWVRNNGTSKVKLGKKKARGCRPTRGESVTAGTANGVILTGEKVESILFVRDNDGF